VVFSKAIKPLAVFKSQYVGQWVGDREVTSHNEEFCDGGVSNSLGLCKRGKAVFAKGFFKSLIMYYVKRSAC
jgi:hypothetical protein